jgi:hypothetical protein
MNWSGGILLNPSKIVDRCGKQVPPDPYIGEEFAGVVFDKHTPGNYLANSDTYCGTFSNPNDCRFANCGVYHRSQMTVAIYAR